MEMPMVENSITECVRIKELEERRQRSYQNISAGRVVAGATPEERFQEFRLSCEHPSRLLRRLLAEEHYIFAPGIYNSGGLKLAAHAGFKAAYLSGHSYALEEHGIDDVGAFSRSEITEQARRMVRAGDYWLREQYVEHGLVGRRIPLVMDLEDGHGGMGQIQTFMRKILPSGVAAGHMEDLAGRRPAHLPGSALISTEKQIKRLLAARSEADQLGVEDFVLIARTDAATAAHAPKGKSGGVDLAVERTLAYAGAEINNRRAIDMAWCEFESQDWEAIIYWARKVRGEHPDLPLAINLSSAFDRTSARFPPVITMEQLADEGFKLQFMSVAENSFGKSGSLEFYKEFQAGGTAAVAHHR